MKDLLVVLAMNGANDTDIYPSPQPSPARGEGVYFYHPLPSEGEE